MADIPVSRNCPFPFISVIVCSYNGSATIRDTMEGLLKLDYPRFEIIVVNDGSTDHTAEIVKKYPVKLVTTRNCGLSSARNTGMYTAQGEILAYIDDDAYPDPHWLQYLAYAYASSGHSATGGPNIIPAEDGPTAICVANAPGGPVHVLSTDEIAEHIPGCNFSVSRSVLMKIGGFDPVFRSAGDDVDVCWRIQNEGHTIGFHPSALVWHHRRNSLKAYWKQQQGYGKAEALLEDKWPEKYNGFGHLTWAGRIYGNGFTLPINLKKGKVFHGVWGTALFQSVYQPGDSLLKCIPLMPEWYLFTVFFGVLGCLGILWSPLLLLWPVFAGSLIVVFTQAVISARENTGLTSQQQTFKSFSLIVFLHIIQPIARLRGRIRHGLTPWRMRGSGVHLGSIRFFRSRTIMHWNEKSWRSNESWLEEIEQNLVRLKARVQRGSEFDRWDFVARIGLFATAKAVLTVEEHGANKQYVKFRYWPNYSVFGFMLIVVLATTAALAAFDSSPIVAGFLAAVSICLTTKYVYDAAVVLSTIAKGFNELSAPVDERENLLNVLSIEKGLEDVAFTPFDEKAKLEGLKVASQN
jgi:glycosyltransferase involved in cell wall biosynthesis